MTPRNEWQGPRTGFVSERLREARLAKRLSLQDVADAVGVSRQAVSQYELGLTVPSDSILGQLVHMLDRPVAFFFWPINRSAEGSSTVFFRKGAGATLKDQGPVRSYLAWLADLEYILERWITLPELSVAPSSEGEHPYDPLTIEQAAQKVRKALGLGDGPIAHVTRLLEFHGAIVAQWSFTTAPVDAGSQWIGRRPYILVGREAVSMARQRFGLAHELGHLVLHSWAEEDMIKRHYSEFEKEAHRFAGAFLMPAKSFTQECCIPSLDHLKGLKPRWKVSISAMIQRAKDLQIFTDDEVRRLHQQLQGRGWRRAEPWDTEWELEAPVLFSQAMSLLEQDQPDIYLRLRNEIPLPVTDIAGLTHLEPSRFESRLRISRSDH